MSSDQIIFSTQTYDKDSLHLLQNAALATAQKLLAEKRLRKNPNLRNRKIVRRGKLRYDIELPKNVQSVLPRAHVQQKIVSMLGPQYAASAPRLLLSLAGAEAQAWHTDVEPLIISENNEQPCDCFYITMLTALDRCTPEMGLTQFADLDYELLDTNQSLIFDGLVTHRGGAALVDRSPVIYQVFHKPDYNDRNLL